MCMLQYVFQFVRLVLDWWRAPKLQYHYDPRIIPLALFYIKKIGYSNLFINDHGAMSVLRIMNFNCFFLKIRSWTSILTWGILNQFSKEKKNQYRKEKNERKGGALMEAGRAAQRSARVVPALPAWGVGRRPLTQPANQPLLRCPGRLPPFPLLAPSIQFPSLSLVRKGR